jgi:pyruvate dehydrogenase E1 component beta subunit
VGVDEANQRFSMASEIAAVVASKGFDFLDAPIRMVTAPHTPVPFSPSLEDEYIPSQEKVILAVRETIM